MHNKTKRCALLSLCVMMILSCAFAVVGLVPNLPTAETAVAQETHAAKIGDVTYDTFAEALTAANAMTGNVTVEIYKKVTLNSSLNGSYSSIAFVGKDSDAEIYLDVQGYITAPGKTVDFTDLTLSKSAGGYIGNAGFMNVAFGVYDVAKVNYTNCYFANGAYASSGVVTFEKCTFMRSHDKYSLWAYGDVDTIVNNCTFADYRGVKMYAEGAQKTANLTVKNSDFSALTGKPAIVLTYGEAVALSGNTYSETGVLELDLGGAPNGTPVTSSDALVCVNDNGACGAIVDGKIYQTVADAAAAATSGSVITLLHNSTETVALQDGVAIDTNGFTASNVTSNTNLNAVARIGYNYHSDLVTALKALKAGDTLTLMSDVTIDTKWDNRYTGAKTTVPVVIDGNGHTLKFTGEVLDGYNYLSIFRFEAATTVKNLTIDMSEAISGWGNRLRAISAKADLAVDNCTFIGNAAYSNTNAIIFGEGVQEPSHKVSITNCTFANWKNGVSDSQGGKDTATTLTISNNTFNSASVNVCASENVTFTNNTLNQGWVIITSYDHKEELTVTFTGNTLTESTGASGQNNFINVSSSNLTIDAAATMNGMIYDTMDSFLADVQDGSTITLRGDVKLNGTLHIPADVTFKANGYAITGAVCADGTITFVDHAKFTSFSSHYTQNTININEGACLETTGGRLVIGHGNTFNIVGSIADAKTADVATIQPSLIAPGASFTGNSLTFNATNAYIKFTAYASSKNSAANGTFNFNVTNCIWEQAGSLVFSAPTSNMDPTFNFNLKDSVLKSTSHLVFAVSKGEVVIDNSLVNVDNAQQLEVRGTMIIKNGSIVHAFDGNNENACKLGKVIVDNATYVGSGYYFMGSDAVSCATLVLQNNANVTLKGIANTNVYQDYTSTLNVATVSDNVNITRMSTYEFELTLSADAIQANDTLEATIKLDKAFYSAEYTFSYDPALFTCSADTDNDGEIYVILFNGASGINVTYQLVAKNDLTSVENAELSVSGDVVEHKEQIFNDIVNVVVGDSKQVKISLDYTTEIHADYVQGYSLVLVKGADLGYVYDGVQMFYVEAYEAFAVIVYGAVTEDMVDAKLAKADSACKIIVKSYDVNCEYVAGGKVDIKDATAVYACTALDFAVADYMELFLRADVNNDFKVNMLDVNAVTSNYR